MGEVDKENEQPIDDGDGQKATRGRDHVAKSIDLKTAATEEDVEDKHELSGSDEKERDALPRRVLRSASAQARLAEVES
jgi:hypothetical protein